MAGLLMAAAAAAAEAVPALPPGIPPGLQAIVPGRLHRPGGENGGNHSGTAAAPTGGKTGKSSTAKAPAKGGKAGGPAFAAGKAEAPAKSDPQSGEAAGGNTTDPSADALDHDTIILVNEQRFQGTVLADQPDPDQVAINTGKGVLRIRHDLIARVEYGLVARMAKVKDDDLGGLIELARWCRINRRNDEALQLLTKAVALPGCDLATRGLYAQLVDEQQGPEKALPLYIAYRNGGGNDPDILARLDVLEKAHSAWEEQMRALGLDPGASAESGKPVVAATASNVEEGLEKYAWVGDDPKWANPVTTSQTTLVTPDGPRKVLQVDYAPNPTTPGVDKAAVVLRRPLSLRPGTKLTLLAANRSSKDVRVGMAVKTGNDWTYFEAQPVPLPATSSGQEFVQLTFDLGAATFKAASTNWAYSAKITGLDQVRELQVLIHNGRDKGSLWLAGIAFADAP